MCLYLESSQQPWDTDNIKVATKSRDYELCYNKTLYYLGSLVLDQSHLPDNPSSKNNVFCSLLNNNKSRFTKERLYLKRITSRGRWEKDYCSEEKAVTLRSASLRSLGKKEFSFVES